MQGDNRRLEDLIARFSAFLGIPERNGAAFPVGYMVPADAPERVAAFLTGEPLEIGGKPILRYKAFRALFDEKPRLPSAPSRADFATEAEKVFPAVPLDVLGEVDRMRGVWIERQYGEALAAHGIEVERFQEREAKRLDIVSRYDKGEAGYVAFLVDRHPLLADFIQVRIPVLVDEDARRRHTYIVGKSGSGKSELIKHLAHAYITGAASEASAIIIDPHGDLAEEIASLKDVPEDRLVYFEPAVDFSHFAVVNPFHSSHVESARTEDERKYFITHHAQAIVDGMRAMLGADLTDNMETVLLHCICTILQVRDGSFLDLQEMVAPTKNPSGRQHHLIEVGLGSLFENHRDFFREAFFSDYYTSTRSSVYARLKSLTTDNNFSRCLIGRNTIDLEKAIDHRSVVVFNLAKGVLSADRTRALGCLLLANILSLAFFRQRRPKAQRFPVHLFIDEAQNFISDRIKETLTEARKFGLYLTLAQQLIGQDMDMKLEELVLGNTDVKITGHASYKSHSKFAHETGVSVEKLQRLGKWQFFLASGETLRAPLRTFDHLVGTKGCLPQDGWQERKARQLARYYRRAGHEPALPPAAAADDMPQWETL
jgi:energy-coupling factor transporter ATP-binding protein EcfA2